MRSLPAWSWSVATNIANMGFGISTGVLVARLLGPEIRGELAEVQFWSSAVAAIGICSLPSSLSYFTAREEHPRSLTASALTLSALLAAISVIGGVTVIALVANPSLRTLSIVYLVLFVPANFVGLTLMSTDHGNQIFRRYNVFRLLPQATYLVLILLFWWQGHLHVLTLLIAMWLGTFLVCAGRLAITGRDLKCRPRQDQMRMLLQTGLAHHATAFAGILFQNADRLICVTYFSHADLGRYAVALNLSGAGLGVVSSATSIVLFPKLTAAVGAGVRRHIVRNSLGASFIVALGVNCLIALSVPLALPLLFGEAFAGAVPVAMLLCLAQVPASFVQTSTIALRALDDWRAGPYAQIVALGVFVPAAACLVPQLGLQGLAISLLLAQTAAAGLMLRRLHAQVGLKAFECLTPEAKWVVSQLPRRIAEAG